MYSKILFILSIFCAICTYGQKPLTDHLEQAKTFYRTYKYDSAYIHAKKIAADSTVNQNDTLWLRAALLAQLSAQRKKIPDSTAYIEIVKEIAYQRKNPEWMIEAEFGQGTIYYLRGDYPEALKNYLAIDSLSKAYNIENTTTIAALLQRSEISRLAFTYQSVNAAYDMAIEAIKKARRANIKSSIHMAQMRLADLSGLREQYEDAKKYADSALSYYLNVNDTRKVSRIYWIYSSYFTVTNQPDSVEKSHLKRLAYLKQTTDEEEIASALVAYGNFFRSVKKDCAKALPVLEEAKKKYETIGESKNDRYLRLIVGMALCEAELGNYKKAFQLYDTAFGLKVELVIKANNELTRQMETKYQTREKEQKIQLLNQEQQLLETQKKNQRNLYLGLLGLGFVTMLLLFFGYRNKIKTAQKLNELNELKSRFFANISHEFRTPLTLIKSPVQQLQSKISNEEHNKQLQLIDSNANRMLELVNQLLELSKIDSGKLQIILKKGNLQHFFHSIVEPFSFKAKDEKQKFNFKIDNLDFETHFDKDIITKITTNLLDNAFKYNDDGKPIDLIAKKENQNLIIQVRNYNNQLKEADYKKLFERFYQKDNAISGFGIGLALVKDLVELYEGTIKSDFKNGQISFTVELPLKKDLKNAVVINENIEVTSESSIPIEGTSNSEFPILLVVDDNASIREVIKDIFATNFQILEATNGKEALKLAQKEIPDCIISDVMMPEMDGFEFTNQIKYNEITSFIPVILLTAKSSDDAHLKALQNTADAFLTKPFNHEVLKATVFQQIQERKKLQERYSQELILKPTEVVINSVDEKFIAKLETVLEKAIPNSEFNAETFANEMHMSRMQLHRKLKSLFGVSATEFIRNERLKMAADLLKNEKLSVSEIAYNVGFNDVGYFSKCFKERYHLSPFDYQKKQH